MKQRTKNAIDDCLQTSIGNMKTLIAALSQKQIYTVLRQNTEGRLYGITFVDNQNKCVFNGSDLGKGYSSAALQSRLSSVSPNISGSLSNNDNEATGSSSGSLYKDIVVTKTQTKELTISAKNESLLDVLLSTKEQYDNVPSSLLKKKRRKKKKKDNNF